MDLIDSTDKHYGFIASICFRSPKEDKQNPKKWIPVLSVEVIFSKAKTRLKINVCQEGKLE